MPKREGSSASSCSPRAPPRSPDRSCGRSSPITSSAASGRGSATVPRSRRSSSSCWARSRSCAECRTFKVDLPLPGLRRSNERDEDRARGAGGPGTDRRRGRARRAGAVGNPDPRRGGPGPRQGGKGPAGARELQRGRRAVSDRALRPRALREIGLRAGQERRRPPLHGIAPRLGRTADRRGGRRRVSRRLDLRGALVSGPPPRRSRPLARPRRPVGVRGDDHARTGPANRRDPRDDRAGPRPARHGRRRGGAGSRAPSDRPGTRRRRDQSRAGSDDGRRSSRGIRLDRDPGRSSGQPHGDRRFPRRPRHRGMCRQRDSVHRGRAARRADGRDAAVVRAPAAALVAIALATDEPLAPFLESRPEGLYCPAFEASIDPPLAARRAIVSHAHSDHAAPGHEEIWATPETIALYRRRNPDWAGRSREIGYGERFERQGVTLELYPAGHVLGSAQIFFEGDGRSLLFTADFKRRLSRTAVPAAAPPAEILATETTFGLPVFRFREREEIEGLLVAACRRAFEEEKTPILLAYGLGKSQEVALALADAGIPTVLHGAAWKLLPEFEAAGHSFPLSRAYETGPAKPGEALVVPPNCARTPVVRNVKRRRIVYLSGWATREASRADFDADVLLPMSDHAGFPELLQHVSDVAPQRVVTLHGYARDFARILRTRGTPAEPLPSGTERLAREESEQEAET